MRSSVDLSLLAWLTRSLLAGQAPNPGGAQWPALLLASATDPSSTPANGQRYIDTSREPRPDPLQVRAAEQSTTPATWF